MPSISKSPLRLLACLAAVSLAASLACGAAVEPRGRVLLVGIDGATLRVAEPLMAEGRLPNLARIAEEGVHGPLRSLPPYLSPRVWTTIATGKPPEQHGITGWVKPSRTDTTQLFYGSDRQGAALWNIASRAGLRVGVVNWLMTYPPERVRGVMVSDHTFEGEVEGKKFIGEMFAGAQGKQLEPIKKGEERGAVVFPPEWTPKVLSEKHRQRQLTPVADPFFENAALPRQLFIPNLSNFYARDQQLTSVAEQIEEEIHPDLMMVLLQGVDRVSHFLWGGLEEARAYPKGHPFTANERSAAREALLTYYEYSDALIGRLVEPYGPDDLVMVVSDHGFEAATGGFQTGSHTTSRAEDGVVFARGRGVPSGASAGAVTVMDVTPTILAWLGLPAAENMGGRVAPFLEISPRSPVASYDDQPVERISGAPSGADEAMLEQLRVLGYVE